MCNGPLVQGLLLFTIPVILTGILQLLYNAIDMVVIGRYVGSQSLAAVGSTTNVLKLFTNFIIALSVGLNVLIAQHRGAGEDKEANEALHTSFFSGFILSLFLGGCLFVFARPILVQMNTPADVLGKAVVYLRIYIVGAPALLIYNFGAAALRGYGDTRRPLQFLMISGLLHVILNLLFVLMFNMDVAGVAWATTISQYVSAFMVIACLMKMDGILHFSLRRLKINKVELGRVAGIGFPSAVQTSMFSISNVIIQAAVNAFGSTVVAAWAAADNVDGFMCIVVISIGQAVTAFVGQNVGAKNYGRIRKIMTTGMWMTVSIIVLMSILAYLSRRLIFGIYVTNPEVISLSAQIFAIYCMGYFILGIEQVVVGTIQGTGYTYISMVASVFGACVPRVIWVYAICAQFHSVLMLAIGYPMSWFVVLLLQSVGCVIALRKVKSDIDSRLVIAEV